MPRVAYASAEVETVEGLSSAPEILVEGYRGAVVSDSLVKLNFFSLLFDASSKSFKHVGALRLAIPTDEFPDIVRALNELLSDMQGRDIPVKDSRDVEGT
jgi:hypothetical protein